MLPAKVEFFVVSVVAISRKASIDFFSGGSP